MKIASPWFAKHVDKDILFYLITSLLLKYSRFAQSPRYVVENEENNRGKRNCYFILRSYKICRPSPSLRLLGTISLERKEKKESRLLLEPTTLNVSSSSKPRWHRPRYSGVANTWLKLISRRLDKSTPAAQLLRSIKPWGCHLEKCLIRDTMQL